jgi:hypothetical protein
MSTQYKKNNTPHPIRTNAVSTVHIQLGSIIDKITALPVAKHKIPNNPLELFLIKNTSLCAFVSLIVTSIL